MQLGIIGAGNVGNALAAGWIKAGHTVTFGIRNPDAPPDGPAGAAYASVAEAARGADVLVLATPWDAVPDALGAAGDLAGKVVIDCNNPLRMGADGLELDIGHITSGGEHVASLAPGASVFKALNQAGFANMEHAHEFARLPAAIYVAGDDAARKPLVLSLVSALGFQAIDAGPLRIARLLGRWRCCGIHMALNRGQPMSRAFAVTQHP